MVRKMKTTKFTLCCSLALALLTAVARADIMAEWTFETSGAGTGLMLSNSAASPNATAEGGVFAGTSIANGLHASVNTDWTSPVGNGSAESFSANEWAIGDYWQFSSSSTGYQDISISWHQTRSGTGPATWDLYWSTDNTTYNLLLNDYVVPAIGWSSITPDATGTTVFPAVPGPAALNNQATVYFRLVADSAAGGTTGTSRVDNVMISANPIPAPGALALLALAGLISHRPRRR